MSAELWPERGVETLDTSGSSWIDSAVYNARAAGLSPLARDAEPAERATWKEIEVRATMI